MPLARRTARAALAVALVGIGSGLLVGCGLSGSSAGGSAVQDSVATAIRTEAVRVIGERVGANLSGAGQTLAAPVACTPDLVVVSSAATASGSVSCTGRTTAGAEVKARFSGTLTTATCSGTLSIQVAGATVPADDLTGCALTRILGAAQGGDS